MTVMISYFLELTPTVSIYSISTCLIVLVLITLFDRGGTTKHLSPKQANSTNVILLLEIFTRTYTDIYKYWNYLPMFSFVHN